MTDPHIACRSVLVVDDDEIMRELLSAILKTEGHTVHTACSGPEALEWLGGARETATILLVDLQMPGMESCELVMRLNAIRSSESLLIGMSGSKPKASVRASFDAFLQKPFGIDAFREAVKHSPASQMAKAGTPADETAKKMSRGEGPAIETATLDEVIYARLAAMLPQEQLHELYRLSMDDVLRRVELMRVASANGDIEQYRREAHSLKGGCSMVGATELSAMASEVEKGSLDGTPPFDDFTAACSRLRRMLDARR